MDLRQSLLSFYRRLLVPCFCSATTYIRQVFVRYCRTIASIDDLLSRRRSLLYRRLRRLDAFGYDVGPRGERHRTAGPPIAPRSRCLSVRSILCLTPRRVLLEPKRPNATNAAIDTASYNDSIAVAAAYTTTLACRSNAATLTMLKRRGLRSSASFLSSFQDIESEEI